MSDENVAAELAIAYCESNGIKNLKEWSEIYGYFYDSIQLKK